MNPLCWSVIRNQTRDALLAGIQDAFDVVDRSTNDPEASVPGALASETSSLDREIDECTSNRTESDSPAAESQSVWRYIRARTCRAVLAGMLEAMEGEENSKSEARNPKQIRNPNDRNQAPSEDVRAA